MTFLRADPFDVSKNAAQRKTATHRVANDTEKVPIALDQRAAGPARTVQRPKLHEHDPGGVRPERITHRVANDTEKVPHCSSRGGSLKPLFVMNVSLQ